jgi:hypothetical protein
MRIAEFGLRNSEPKASADCGGKHTGLQSKSKAKIETKVIPAAQSANCWPERRNFEAHPVTADVSPLIIPARGEV